MVYQVSSMIQQEMGNISACILVIISVWACVFVCTIFLLRSLIFHRNSQIRTILIVLAWAVYVCIIVYITLGSRELGSRNDARWIPFKYIFLNNGKLDILAMVRMMLNIALFIPLGLFSTLLLLRSSYMIGLLLVTSQSLLFSMLIEVIQRVSKLGYFELEDIICNTLGGIVGWFVARLLIYLYRTFHKRYLDSSYF